MWKFVLALAAAGIVVIQPVQAQQAAACGQVNGARPVASTRTLPPYPPMSVMTNESGTTLLMVTIGADGKPTDVQVDTSSGSLRLDEAARDHVRSVWTWTPPLAACGPGPTRTKVSVKWDLKDARERFGFSMLSMPKSEYPAESLQRREQGTAVVMVLLVPGEVPVAVVLESSGFPALDKKSVDLLAARRDWTIGALGGVQMTTAILVETVWRLE